jgi:hypothetical protein
MHSASHTSQVLVTCLSSPLLFQFAQSADVEKRDLSSIPFVGTIMQEAVDKVVNDTNSFITGALSTLAGRITQAQSIVQNYIDQAKAVVEAAKAPLDSLLQAATEKIQAIVGNPLQYGWNSTLCVAGQAGNAESIVKQAGRAQSRYYGNDSYRLAYKLLGDKPRQC